MAKNLIRMVWRDASGNAVVETAMYLPLALLMFAGMADFTLAVSQRLIAQQAVARALELASNADFDQLTEQMLRSEAAGAAGVPEANVQPRIWLECDGVAQASGSTGCANASGLAWYAGVTIRSGYQLPLYSRLAGMGSQSDALQYQVQGSVRVQ